MNENDMINENQQEAQKVDFETKIKNAQKLLDELLKPDITLSNSVQIYKKGLNELQEAQKLLDKAKLEFEEYLK
jgi:exodeoxyribonuclease VII small subunit